MNKEWRVDVTDKELRMWKLYNKSLFVPAEVVIGIILFFAMFIGFVAADEHDVSMWWGFGPLIALLIGGPAVTIHYLKFTQVRKPWLSCGCYHYGYGTDLDKNCKGITVLWHDLNEDNKAICKPLVTWVYDHNHKKDTYGQPLYKSEVAERYDAVSTVLDEQRKLEYFKADIDNSDVQAVLEYAKSMQSARETLFPPAIEAPKVPETREERTKRVARQAKEKALNNLTRSL